MKNDEECESQIKKYPWIIELDKKFKQSTGNHKINLFQLLQFGKKKER